MSRDKVEHYYLLTASSSLNICNATWNPHKEDPRGCWAHCIEVPKWQVNAVPSRYEGTMKNLGLIARFVLCLSAAFVFFFPFVTLYCASPKTLHDQQYQLETLRDWFFVNKNTIPKALHGQQYQLETQRDWIFFNKTYKKLTSSKHFGGLGTLAGDVV
jgi:hypothetical protein